MTDAALTIRGVKYLGWTDISVTRSMLEIAPTFQLTLHDKWALNQQPIAVAEGDPCNLALGQTDIITGYVDESIKSYDGVSRALRVSGRSRTGDLVDCAAVYAAGRGQFRNQTILQIAIALCQPFGIDVTAQAPIGLPFRRFAIHHGETVFETLERAGRLRGVLFLSDELGNLVISRAGVLRSPTAVKYGANILSGERTGSFKDRFSTYTFKHQVAGDDQGFGIASSIRVLSLDPGLGSRYRPFIGKAEGETTITSLQTRADWERNVRAGKSQKLRYIVSGWEHAAGLWSPNTIVHVSDPEFQVDHDLLIVSTTHSKGSDGTKTELVIMDPRAVSVEPLVPKPVQRTGFGFDINGDMARDPVATRTSQSRGR